MILWIQADGVLRVLGRNKMQHAFARNLKQPTAAKHWHAPLQKVEKAFKY